jgi:two-component system heavy metal sensor histidine kinase CusS
MPNWKPSLVGMQLNSLALLPLSTTLIQRSAWRKSLSRLNWSNSMWPQSQRETTKPGRPKIGQRRYPLTRIKCVHFRLLALKDGIPKPAVNRIGIEGPLPHYRRPLPAAGEPQNPTRHLAFQVATYEDISVFRIYILPASGGVIAIAAPLSSIEGSLAPLRRAFVFGGPAALAVLALGTIFLLQQAMKPINQLSNEIASLSATSLGNRLDGFRGGSEFGQLIEQYNAMLERLETSFLQAKRFSADAAHELNTPLTILIGQLDEAIQEAKTDSDSQRQLASIQEEANRLIDIVKKLSILAQADSGRLNIVKSPFNASNLVEALVEDMGLIADHLNFRSQILPNVMASGDEGLIRQSLSNLISNAVKYNRVNGTVEVSLKDEADKLVFQVKNTGEAIAEESAGRLFDRFCRVDKARAKSADGGLGLGLSLANEFIKAHGGKLYLACNESDSIVFAFEIPKT